MVQMGGTIYPDPVPAWLPVAIANSIDGPEWFLKKE